MEEIAELLKSTREESGIEIEEVSKDLEINEILLKNIEEGKIGSFKDIFLLKNYISEYAKYLGLNSAKLLDEFNEYLFDYTSKIPLDAIEKAKNNKREVKKEFISPYTVKKKYAFFNPKIVFVVGGIIALLLGGYFIFGNILGSEFSDNNITYVIRR